MDTFSPENPPLTIAPAAHQPKIPGFWGTAIWGAVVFAALFAGQLTVLLWFLLRHGGPIDVDAAVQVASRGLTISLSVVMGLPAVVAALWLAIRATRVPFADYLGLRRFSLKSLLIGIAGLAVLVVGWDLMSRLTGREVQPGFMTDVLKSAELEGVVWLLVIAICVAAPISEELFARGFLYRGWAASPLGPYGAIFLSSLAWTAVHLQYDWYFFGEVFCIGLWLGYLRYRFHSTWLTIVVHGVNNFAALLQSIWLAG
jgi:membrane protease YdiL (CAAX protease family)